MQEAMQVEFVESSLEATAQHPNGADGDTWEVVSAHIELEGLHKVNGIYTLVTIWSMNIYLTCFFSAMPRKGSSNGADE